MTSPYNYVAKYVGARYEHREFFAMGVDLDHGGVEQNWRGGGMFLEHFIGKKQIEKTRGGFLGSYNS